MTQQKFKLLISYDGTNFGGWQRQPNATSIQSLIEDALQTILRTPVPITGSGRTDAGVHALEQVAHFTLDGPLELKRLQFSLNGLLPPAIRILDLLQAEHEFPARLR